MTGVKGPIMGLGCSRVFYALSYYLSLISKHVDANLKTYRAYQHLTLKEPEHLHVYGLYVYYVVHICDFGMLRVKGWCLLRPRLYPPQWADNGR